MNAGTKIKLIILKKSSIFEYKYGILYIIYLLNMINILIYMLLAYNIKLSNILLYFIMQLISLVRT